MKSFINLKIVFAIIITGFLFGCKNNQDGYSDEINTQIDPSDTLKTMSDTIKTTPNSDGPGANEPATTNTNTKSESTAGKGSGPGESPKDGATYTNYTGTQKDSSNTTPKKEQKTKSNK